MANIIDVGLRCHHVATYYAAPLLIAQRRGLIVNISFHGSAKVHDPAHYACKAGLDKLAAVYAEHFTPFNDPHAKISARTRSGPIWRDTRRLGGDDGVFPAPHQNSFWD